MSEGNCHYCAGPVSASSGYRKVVAWERIRRGPTGTKGLVAPEHKAEYACEGCIWKLAKGMSPDQGSLV